MLVLFLVLLLTPCLLATDDSYNYFDFVRQWSPNSCYKSSHKCIHLPQGINYWTIHGLWPSKDASHYPSDCAGGTCYNHFNMSTVPDLLDEMTMHWPTDYSGGNKKFWAHEYCKHGTCCTDVLPSMHEYFATALNRNMKLDVDVALKRAGIVPDLNKPYTFDQLDGAMKTSFGVNRATYWCRFVKGDHGSIQLMFQISVCLNKSLSPVDCPAEGKSCVTSKPFYLLPFSVINTEQ